MKKTGAEECEMETLTDEIVKFCISKERLDYKNAQNSTLQEIIPLLFLHPQARREQTPSSSSASPTDDLKRVCHL